MSNRNLALLFFFPAVLFLGLLNIYCLYKALPALPVSFNDLTLIQLVKCILAIKVRYIVKFICFHYLLKMASVFLAELIKGMK
jgi:hypothetical protein